MPTLKTSAFLQIGRVHPCSRASVNCIIEKCRYAKISGKVFAALIGIHLSQGPGKPVTSIAAKYTICSGTVYMSKLIAYDMPCALLRTAISRKKSAGSVFLTAWNTLVRV